MLTTETKMLTEPHLFSKQAVGYRGALTVGSRDCGALTVGSRDRGAQVWPGEGSSQHRPQLCELLTVLQRATSILSLSFSLKKRLFSEGHGPKMLLRTSHVLSHDEPMIWQGTDGKKE